MRSVPYALILIILSPCAYAATPAPTPKEMTLLNFIYAQPTTDRASQLVANTPYSHTAPNGDPIQEERTGRYLTQQRAFLTNSNPQLLGVFGIYEANPHCANCSITTITVKDTATGKSLEHIADKEVPMIIYPDTAAGMRNKPMAKESLQQAVAHADMARMEFTDHNSAPRAAFVRSNFVNLQEGPLNPGTVMRGSIFFRMPDKAAGPFEVSTSYGGGDQTLLTFSLPAGKP